MHLDQRKYDKNPLKPFEVIIIAILSAAFLFMMTMEILTDFSPRKLSVLLFLVSWIPLLFIHEFGHAIMAKIAGWKIIRISIGFGPRLLNTHAFGVPMEIRVIPLEGFVQTSPTTLHWVRTKNALIYFAGPGIELLIFFSILAVLGSEQMFTVTDNYLDIAIKSFAFAALAGAIINLIPIGIRTEDGTTPNDGLGILQCLFADSQSYAEWIKQNAKEESRK
ncbi:MAG: Unknown protein [uncultured Thiotrichaceae bacterium]|uniref:Peptidase M50 domain-containing protein n=1 Tax=uncultured Thiotrichaceae bacterium TaxID=298394 RepID=A0A6S6TAI0_9GAMM|nr:MAG: Unknown protein [uncultured Thiotrichaceae bacterium]